MHDYGIPLGDLVEDITRPAARVHEVLGDNLEPIDGRPVLKNVREMNAAQTNTKPQRIVA